MLVLWGYDGDLGVSPLYRSFRPFRACKTASDAQTQLASALTNLHKLHCTYLHYWNPPEAQILSPSPKKPKQKPLKPKSPQPETAQWLEGSEGPSVDETW